MNNLAVLTGQIEERKRYIMAINNDVEAIQHELASLELQLHGLEKDLKDKKKKYEASVQYLYKNKSIEEKLMFIFRQRIWGRLIGVCGTFVNMPLINACKGKKS